MQNWRLLRGHWNFVKNLNFQPGSKTNEKGGGGHSNYFLNKIDLVDESRQCIRDITVCKDQAGK